METLANKQVYQSIELDGKRYEYVSYIPGGNPTALVVIKDIPIPEQKKKLNDMIMQQPGNQDIEQVGFVILDKKNPQLEMAGGEFCGNATRSAATWYYEQYGFENINIQVSGVGSTLNAGYNPQTQEAFAQMPIYQAKEKIIRVDENTTIVEMEGITQIIIKGKPACFDQENYDVNIKEEAKKTIKNYSQYPQVATAPAVGVMYLIEGEYNTYNMEPVVYVRSIDTLFYESACGSGTCSVGLLLSQDQENGEFQYTIKQPSGENITIQVSMADNIFANAMIFGPVKKKINQKYIVTEDLEKFLKVPLELFRSELLSILGDFWSKQGVSVKSIGFEELQSFFRKEISDQNIVLALDGGIYSTGLPNVFDFDITRYYTDATLEKIVGGDYEYKTRTGKDIETQIGTLKRFIAINPGKEVIILDDGKFSGGSIKRVLSLLEENDIVVSKVILGVNVGGDNQIQNIPIVSYYDMPNEQTAGRVNERDLTDFGGVKTDKGIVSYLSSPNILQAKEGLYGEVFDSISTLLKSTLEVGRKFIGGINEPNIFDYNTIIRDQDGTLYQLDGDGTFGGSTLGKLVNQSIIDFICEKENYNEQEAQRIKSELSLLEKTQGRPLSQSLAQKYNMTRIGVFEATRGAIEPTEAMILKFEATKALLQVNKEKGIKNIIVTGAPKVRAEKVMKFMGTSDYIDELYTAEDYEGDKGTIFAQIKQTNPSGNIISIGDQEKSDILPALQNGIDGLLIKEQSDLAIKLSGGSKGCILLKIGNRIVKLPGNSEKSTAEVKDNGRAYNEILEICPDILPKVYINSENLIEMEYLGDKDLTTMLRDMDEIKKLELYKSMFDWLVKTANDTKKEVGGKEFLNETLTKIFDQFDMYIAPYLDGSDKDDLIRMKEKLQQAFESINIGTLSSLALFDFTPDNIFLTEDGEFKMIDPWIQKNYIGLPQISLGILTQTLRNYNLTIESFDGLINKTQESMNILIGVDNDTGKKLLILGEIFELCLAIRVRIRNEEKKLDGVAYYNKLIEKVNYLLSL